MKLTESQLRSVIKETTLKVLKEYTDSLGQSHGSLAFNHDEPFAKQIFAMMQAIEAKMEGNPEEIDDYNEQQVYLALKRAYEALYSLVYLELSDY